LGRFFQKIFLDNPKTPCYNHIQLDALSSQTGPCILTPAPVGAFKSRAAGKFFGGSAVGKFSSILQVCEQADGLRVRAAKCSANGACPAKCQAPQGLAWSGLSA